MARFLAALLRRVSGYTPLILAVLGGHLSCVKMLVMAGSEVSQPDGRSGRTPLHHAVEADNVAIAGYLLLEVKLSHFFFFE